MKSIYQYSVVCFSLVIALLWYGGCSLGYSQDLNAGSAESDWDGEEYQVRHISAEGGKYSVVLSWDDLAPLGVEAYHIYFGNREAGAYSLVSRTGESRYEHTGLAKGQILWYKIVALNNRGQELGGGLAKAAPVRCAAFGGPPGPIRVISDYLYQGKGYINLSWNGVGEDRYYAVDIYRQEDGGGETLTPLGGIMIGGSQFFRERNILWDPGDTRTYRFALFEIYAPQSRGEGPEIPPRSVPEEDISIPSALSDIGYISELN